MPSATLPLIGVSACRKAVGPATIHSVADKYVDAVLEAAAGLPLIVPALGCVLPLDSVCERLDGLLLTGSPSNVDPALYGGGPRPHGDPADAYRDGTALPLIRKCIAEGVPVLGICRGIQELNVALGGSLHGRLHEIEGRQDHRSDKTLSYAERYDPSHLVRVRAGGMLARLLGNAAELRVNSLHAQGVDRLAPGLVAEAEAPDGTIEAVSMPGAKGFVFAVQWHAEWRATEIEPHRRLFAAFGEACGARLRARQHSERVA
jgi:putative glutamine amidotransferase